MLHGRRLGEVGRVARQVGPTGRVSRLLWAVLTMRANVPALSVSAWVRGCVSTCIAFVIFFGSVGVAGAAVPERLPQLIEEARATGDLTSLRELISPDVSWTYSGPDYAIPFAT